LKNKEDVKLDRFMEVIEQAFKIFAAEPSWYLVEFKSLTLL
jgi:hypothetical protein